MKRFCLAGLVALLPVLPALPAPSSTNEFVVLKTGYERDVAALQEAFAARMARWRAGYRKALEALQGSMSVASNAPGWTAVKGELERFSEERSMDEGHVVQAVDALKELQTESLAAMAAAQSEIRTAAARVAGTYAGRLDRLAARLDAGGRPAEAAAVRNESQRLHAEFADLAAAPAETGAAPEANPTNAAPAAEETNAPPGAPAAAGIALTPEVRAFPGQIDPFVPGHGYEKLMLTRTGNSPVAQPFVVAAAAERTYVRPAGATNTAPRLETVSLRFSLKTVPAADAVSNALAVAKWYSRPLGSRQKLIPTLLATRRARIAKVDPSGMVLEFSPVAVPGSQFERGGEPRKSTAEFYGVILSVCDGANGLLYQAVSTRGLLDEAYGDVCTPSRQERLAEIAHIAATAKAAYEAARDAFLEDVDSDDLKAAFKAARDEFEAAQAEQEAEAPAPAP